MHQYNIKNIGLLILLLISTINTGAQLRLNGTIWDAKELYDVPRYTATAIDSAKEIVFESAMYKGQKKKVFAYYATPGILHGNPAEDKNLPAVVLVHGGGGKAFREWAVKWAEKGYAAIAMDLRGNGADRKQLPGGFEEINGVTPVYDMSPPLTEQYLYQAVADVILSHNLLLSFPEVDKNRTALTGISWGGVISCIAAGLDNRYKAVVPVYGCGFLEWSGFIGVGIRQLPQEGKQRWINQYDPLNYIAGANMPMLFINGTNDRAFYLSSYIKTYQLVRKGNISVKVRMEHSHKDGWNNDEIYAFVDSYLKGARPFPFISHVSKGKKAVNARIGNNYNIDKGYLHYTTDTTVVEDKRQWLSMPARINGNRIQAPLPPANAVLWYIQVENKEGVLASSCPRQ
ncbi:alpha/beta fold hydrolase [Chitinophaga sp. 212800010-3]|uniref:alpha/beta hydrolase family protein n=1 Tax=unclassified Chitinophaga TaxID=2619133 RepID=UPI002DF6B760|nr:AXE1 domain-containing protein [Chitinophaga sp. 212800010-3]